MILVNDPILKQKARSATMEEAKAIADELSRVRQEENGLGIAAPQIGKSLRVINVVYRGKELTLINPAIKCKRGTFTVMEGCLSVPDYNYIVKRPEHCIAYGTDLQGNEVKLRCELTEASLLCHEVDHLDGILISKIGIKAELKVKKEPEDKVAFANE
jgi:peptide deformylase